MKILTLTSGNYASAVELLKERFGKPQLIISAHGRLSSLRYLYDEISINVRVWLLWGYLPTNMEVF